MTDYGGTMPPPPPGGGFQPGAQPPPGYGYGPAPQRATNGLAIASLVLGIVWLFGLGSLLAVIFGHLALGQIKRTGEGGRGLAIAGLILGYLVLGLIVLSVLAVTLLGRKATNNFSSISTSLVVQFFVG